MVDKHQTISNLFDILQANFEAWAKDKPNGEFKVIIPLHEGGFREPCLCVRKHRLSAPQPHEIVVSEKLRVTI